MKCNNNREFIKKYKRNKYLVLFSQIFIFVLFIVIWELLARFNIINTFITSSPSNVLKTIITLFKSGDLFVHIYTTFKETVIAFLITGGVSILISILLYRFKTLAKICDPYLTMLNSLPKVAFGPILIIWIGANTKSIITMAVLISIITSIQAIYNGFKQTDKNKIKLLKTFNATNTQILTKVVIPSNSKTIINTLKINIGLCLVGIIMGEFLTSKAGLGYLILYGSQIFNLDLVMSGIILLLIISVFLYKIINIIEKRLDK